MINISYAITACNEDKELDLLLERIVKHKDSSDEIVVLLDTKSTNKVLNITQKYIEDIKIFFHDLNNNFSVHKNYLNSKCTKDYIFQLDADEYVEDNFLENIKELLKLNSTIEVYRISRINTVEGLTNKHIQKWGWRTNDKGWINFPDPQNRIYKNKPEIKWERKVHEYLVGYKYISHLPYTEEWAIRHPKKIEKQEKQNKMYEEIFKEKKNS